MSTIAAEEKLRCDVTCQEEIELLERETKLSVEELPAMYGNKELNPDAINADECAVNTEQVHDASLESTFETVVMARIGGRKRRKRRRVDSSTDHAP